jgi:hypothetical protein
LTVVRQNHNHHWNGRPFQCRYSTLQHFSQLLEIARIKMRYSNWIHRVQRNAPLSARPNQILPPQSVAKNGKIYFHVCWLLTVREVTGSIPGKGILFSYQISAKVA